MYFKRLELQHWQQFEEVDLELHDKLTILTGANGSGKTTILNIFAKYSGWNSSFLSVPKEEKTGEVKFCSRFFGGVDKSLEINIGKITYSNNNTCNLMISSHNTATALYQIHFQSQQPVECIYIPSHKVIYRYQTLSNIPTLKKNTTQAFQEVSAQHKSMFLGGSSQSVSFLMKNTLIGWVINGYGIKKKDKIIMPEDSEQIRNFEGFQDVLKKILPRSLGFKELVIRNMEIVLVCNNGADEFLLETVSGGISVLIDIAWQIYMYSSQKDSGFTVIIDEVENHLHPIMQRTILQDLLDAFPTARFIISTHSPLIVSAVKNSNIYVLTYNNKNKIQSQKLDLLGEAKTAAEILDEVLGVSFTMPIWVEERLNEIIIKYSKKLLDDMDFTSLRTELADLGLERMVTFAVQSIIDNKDD